MTDISLVQKAQDALNRANGIVKSTIVEATAAEEAHATAVNDLENAIAANLMGSTPETKQRLKEAETAERAVAAKRDYASLTVNAARKNVATLEKALEAAQHREASDIIQAASQQLGTLSDEIDATITRLFLLIAQGGKISDEAELAVGRKLDEPSLSNPGAWRKDVMYAIKTRAESPGYAPNLAPCSAAAAIARRQFNRAKTSHRYTPTNADVKEAA